jgi:hypothetical protein
MISGNNRLTALSIVAARASLIWMGSIAIDIHMEIEHARC